MIKTEQFVMAYKVEQDRLRAMMPEGFESLRPVLRINAEICGGRIYLEFNTPVAAYGKRGWLNIDNWSSSETEISYIRNGSNVRFDTLFIEITFTGIGIEGGCPAEKDNCGCWFMKDGVYELVHPEKIDARKEFCDCSFQWKFQEGDAHGVSIGGKTLPAATTGPSRTYDKIPLTAETAAHIKCEQMLGQYKVIF